MFFISQPAPSYTQRLLYKSILNPSFHFFTDFLPPGPKTHDETGKCLCPVPKCFIKRLNNIPHVDFGRLSTHNPEGNSAQLIIFLPF